MNFTHIAAISLFAQVCRKNYIVKIAVDIHIKSVKCVSDSLKCFNIVFSLLYVTNVIEQKPIKACFILGMLFAMFMTETKIAVG